MRVPKVHLSTFAAARICPDDPPDDPSARFGRYWFCFWPRVRTNGGAVWRSEVLEVTAHWLYFGVALTFWPRS